MVLDFPIMYDVLVLPNIYIYLPNIYIFAKYIYNIYMAVDLTEPYSTQPHFLDLVSLNIRLSSDSTISLN